MNFEIFRPEERNGGHDESIALEHAAMRKYFSERGIEGENRVRWVNEAENAVRLRALAERDPEFLRAYANDTSVTWKEFEERLYAGGLN